MSEHEHYKFGVGPVYSIPLIDVLPLNPEKPGGMRQAMPSAEDLEGVKDYRHGQRVVAGYEVLLHHWRIQKQNTQLLHDSVQRLQSALRGIRREFGHMSINNGTSTLGLFIDAAIKNDTEYAKATENDANRPLLATSDMQLAKMGVEQLQERTEAGAKISDRTIQMLVNAGIENVLELKQRIVRNPEFWYRDVKGVGKDTRTPIEDALNEVVAAGIQAEK